MSSLYFYSGVLELPEFTQTPPPDPPPAYHENLTSTLSRNTFNYPVMLGHLAPHSVGKCTTYGPLSPTMSLGNSPLDKV